MKENKKPKWLLDAEKAASEFNESKSGKMTDADISRSISMKGWYQTEEGKEHREVSITAMLEAAAVWREENPEKVKENASRGGIASGAIGCKEWRAENPERAKEITALANKAFMESDYFLSDEHRASLSRGAKSSAKVQLEKGNIGPDSFMSKYKMEKNRVKWANALIKAGTEKNLPAHFKQFITGKTWHNVRTRSNLVIQLDEKGGHHNTQHFYKLNMDEINKYLNHTPVFGKPIKLN